MTKWQEVKLGDICTILNGRAYKQEELLDNGKYSVLRVGNFFSRDKWYYSNLELEENKYCDNGDLLFAWSASFGPKIWDGGKVIYHYHIWKMLPNPQVLDKYYLFCWLQKSVSQLTQGIHGSVMAHLTKSDMENILFTIPPLEVQKKIAGVLGALDDKIELNNKINNNLEQQAQALFKSWFVDFEPFGGVMPEDWKVGNLLDIADYLNGLAMQKFRPTENGRGLPVLKIKELRQGFCDNSSELCSSNVKREYVIDDGDVIFSWSGSLLVDFWCGGKCGLNQHLFKVTSEKFEKWFYYSWTKHYLNKFVAVAADKATTMGHIKRDELEKAEVVIPSSIDYQKIGKVLSPIYDLIIQNRIENTRLAAIRDTLLPKLMSGEIDVSNVDISALTSTDKLSFTK